MKFAKRYFILKRRAADEKSSLGDHLAAAAAARPGSAVSQFAKEPEPPKAIAFLWLWYMDLCAGRQLGPHGMQSLPATEILAWATVHGLRLEPWQYRALRLLDATHLSAIMGKAEETTAAELISE